MKSEILDNEPLQGRPKVLSFLCIITFSFGIFKIILFSLLELYLNTPHKDSDLTGIINSQLGIKTPNNALAWIGVTLVAMSGAWLMWKLKKPGFYIYSVASTTAYLLPALFAGTEMMTIQRLFFSSIFIFFYGMHLKFLK
jgi:hypothetical protein